MRERLNVARALRRIPVGRPASGASYLQSISMDSLRAAYDRRSRSTRFAPLGSALMSLRSNRTTSRAEKLTVPYAGRAATVGVPTRSLGIVSNTRRTTLRMYSRRKGLARIAAKSPTSVSESGSP